MPGLPILDASPTTLVVLQPTTYCNLDCAYCYLPLTATRSRMSLETVAAAGRLVRDLDVKANPLPIAWHAGEPLTVNPEFYREAFGILKDTVGPIPLRHVFQTNGTLIDDRWCNLFAEWGVDVGVSVDGPAWMHDRSRRDRHNRGTFDRVLTSIGRLREAGVNPTVITVLRPQSLAHPKEVWEALTDTAGFTRIAFNIEESEGANVRGSETDSNALLRAYESFLLEIVALRAARPDVHVRELDDMKRFLSYEDDVSSIENVVGGIVSVSRSGEISTFSPELSDLRDQRYGRFTWGNVHTTTWAEVRQSGALRAVTRDILDGVEECRRVCEYFSVCGGGAPSNKLGEHGTFAISETLDCRLRVQTVADVFLSTLDV